MWVAILVSLAISVVSYLLTPRPKPQAQQPGQIDIPETKDGEPIPIVFGQAWIEDPHIAYWGNQSTTAIRKSGGKK